MNKSMNNETNKGMSDLKTKAAKTITLVTLITLASKLFGYFRDALIAYRFGSGEISDSYFTVAGVTILLAELIVNASLTSSIPIFSQVESDHGKREKLKYLAKLVTLIAGLTLIIVLLGEILAPQIIKIVAAGFTGSQFFLSVKLLRLAFPAIIFSGMVGVIIGYLQSENRFYLSSASRIIFNLICILYLVFFTEVFGIEGMMLTTVAATIMQYLVMRYNLRSTGYRYHFSLSLKDEYIKQALRLSVPVFLGIATYDINIMFDRSFASTLSVGNISQLTYAAKVEALIISIFISAVMTYSYPLLSQQTEDPEYKDLKFYLARVINLNMLIAIPATAALIAFAQPIVQILFERGEFDRQATIITSTILKLYALGIIAKSLREVLMRIFYILQESRQVLLNGALTIILNIILNFIVITSQKVALLALTTSLSISLSTIILMIKLRKKIGSLPLKNMLTCFSKSLIASIIMLIPTTFFNQLIILKASTTSNSYLFISLSLTTILGILIYFVLIYIFRIKEAEEILQIIFSKLKK